LKLKQIKKEDLPAANALIRASKSFWDYPKEYLEAAFPLLQISEEHLKDQSYWGLMNENEFIGIFSFSESLDDVLLDHFWISPEYIGKGQGRILWNHAALLAMERGYMEFKIFSDPPAEPFYLKMGARKIGEKPSRISSGPVFPILRYVVAS